jgi:ubiquinone/menaquinone biosynthesis C-methylase UbiE
MGRYAIPLAPRFAEFAGVRPGWRVIDVGAGPGALTGVLTEIVGASSVAAVDPSEPFVTANRERYPGVEVLQGTAEHLPFPDDSFDAALAQLVVQFMSDPVAGLAEMARVTRPGGVVATCVWDFGTGRAPLTAFWTAAAEIDPSLQGERDLAGVRPGQLTELFEKAAIAEVEEAELAVTLELADFDTWWEPMTFGVGPAGSWLAKQPADVQAQVRERIRGMYPDAPGIRTAFVWAVRGRAA